MTSHKWNHAKQAHRLFSLVVAASLLGAMLHVGVPTAFATDVGSPYIVTSPVLVAEGVTLTIQPGVTVKFTSHEALQIQGALIAQG